MPSGSGYVLSRFRPFQCTTLQVSSTPWKLNAALGFALFDNSTEMILTENEMKWQRFNVSTVSQKKHTLHQKKQVQSHPTVLNPKMTRPSTTVATSFL